MKAREWQASPRYVRVFHGSGSTVIDRVDIDQAKRLLLDHPMVVVGGFELDESDVDSMRAAMTEQWQIQMADYRAEQSMGGA